MTRIWSSLLLIMITTLGCNPDDPAPIVKHATEQDFEEAKEVSPVLAEGLELSLWAPGPLLFNAVSVTFDPSGAAYVSETTRRKSSDIDIRAHPDWMIDDLSLESLKDTRAFHKRVLDPSLSDQNDWMGDFNGDSIRDYHDLTIQTEYIHKVWDSDGDGKADRSQQFASGFNDMLTGIAAGILHFDDKLYLTAAPDLWLIEDRNNDGQADKKESLSHGYGIHVAFAGHDMSGLTIGPDGRIYWSIGDLGVNVTSPDGRQWKYPNQGCVMRCNPDGTDFEVFAHGLRNTQELAFDTYGNLISVDNDGDHPGEHERYVHIIEGSDSGWRINWQYGKYNQPNDGYKVWMDEQLYLPHFEGQAAYIIPAIALAYDGPAGLAYNPGTALSEEWEDHFFASYFTASAASSKIEAFQIKQKGASFDIAKSTDVLGGIVPTGITFAPDGALYINDWKDSYDKKPEGRLWKLDVDSSDKHPLSAETEALIREGMSGRNTADLTELIGHQDQRVRMGAQFELVKRGDTQLLIDMALDGNDLLGRLHAIWGLGQLGRQHKTDLIQINTLLKDESYHVRGQVAKVFGEAYYKVAEAELLQLLDDEEASVQFFASEALGKVKSTIAFGPLTALLASIEETDPHLRHAIVYALSKLATADQLADLSSHPSKYVRIGAVVALRHQKAPEVTRFLSDSEELVLVEAARAINDDFSIPEALPALAESLINITIQDEAFIRRAINANLRLGDAASALRLASFINNSNVNIAMRQDALWSLGSWSDPPALDRVTGRYRGLSGHVLEDGQRALQGIFSSLIEETDSGMKTALIEAAGRLNCKDLIDLVSDEYIHSSSVNQVRYAALQTLSQLESKDIITHVDSGLSSDDIELRQLAQDILGSLEMDEEAKLPLFKSIMKNNTWQEKQVALRAISKMSSVSAEEYLSELFQKFIEDELDPEIQLDLMLAIESSQFENVKQEKSAYESSIPDDDKLIQYKTTLFGGDVDRGLNILSRNEAAQCLRCHAIKGYGGVVGPELTHIASTLLREDILLSLVAPSARIAPGYGTVSLVLDDGTEVVGILSNEREDIIEVKEGDKVTTYQKGQIKDLQLSRSAMFNTADVLTKGQIRDLVTFLVTLE